MATAGAAAAAELTFAVGWDGWGGKASEEALAAW